MVNIPGTFTTFNGEVVSGGGLPNGTTIVSGGGSAALTLSNNITSPAGATTLLTFGSKGASTLTATLAGSTAVTGLSSTSGLYVGQPVSGPGIPAGTMVAAVTSSSAITLSTAATSTGSQSLTFGTGSTSAPGYSGGTVIDQGTVNLSGPGVGTVVIPAGGLTLVGTQAGITATTLNVGVSSFNSNIVGIGGQIDASNDVTMIGKTILNLAGINTLHSLTFTNNGGDGAPTVNVAPTGTVPVSILDLSSSSPITASVGTNPSQTSVLSGGTVGLAPGTNTLDVEPIQINGTTVTQIVPNLSITSVIAGIGSTGNGVGILKTGAGLLQLSGASTFDQGVTLSNGGIAIGASSTGTAAGSSLTSGPLGIGTFNIGNGSTAPGSVYLTSTAAANTILNPLSIGANNDLNFKGPNGLTLTGNLTLNSSTTTVNVDVPGSFLTLGGVVSDSTGGTSNIVKNGLGTFALTNNNTFGSAGGTVTVNQGVLALGGATGAAPTPLANPSITLTSNGTLALMNNGSGNNGLIQYTGLNVTVNASSNYANIFVSNASTIGVAVASNGSGNTIQIPTLNMTGNQTLNLGASNAYSLIIANINDTTGVPQINVPAGMTAFVYTYSAGDKPVNVGLGNLIFPDVLKIGSSTLASGNSTIELSTYNGSNYYPLVLNNPTSIPTSAPTGFTSGGLNAYFSSLASAPAGSPLSTAMAGIGFSGSGYVVSHLNDTSDSNRPLATNTTFSTSVVSLNGLLHITTGSTYTFRSATDDAGILYVDGNAVLSDTLSAGHAITQASGTGQIYLTAGYHTINYFENSM